MIATLHPELLKLLPNRHAWTRAEFERIADLGAFGDQKVELIEGEIVEKMTQDERHVFGVYRTSRVLEKAFAADRFMVRVQSPLALGDASLPEPDIAVVPGSWAEGFQGRPASAILIVEISNTTLDTDRTIKASLYARECVADYWIVNVQERTVEVHRDPVEITDAPLGWGYRSVQIFTEAQSIAPLAAPENLVPVAELLP